MRRSRRAKLVEAAVKAAGLAKAQTVVAENATKEADAQTRLATSRQLAALSVAERDKRFDRSLLLAVASLPGREHLRGTR